MNKKHHFLGAGLLLLALAAGWAAGGAIRLDSPPSPAAPPPLLASDLDLDITAQASATGGIWMYPGVRNLQPSVFGTLSEPLGEEFFIGVPLYDRLDDGQGSYTTTANLTMASNVTVALQDDARVSLTVRNRTPGDQPGFTATTHDEIRLRCSFTDPFGRFIEIKSDQCLPKGPFHEFFGGVATNVFLHGRTGLGGKLPPQVFTYVSTWSVGTVTIDGVLLPNNDQRLVHTMVSHGMRDAGNAPGPAGGNGPFMGSDAEVDKEDLEFHLVLPPVRFRPGPQPNTPVVGMGQEFVHLVFESVTLSGSTINGVIQR